MREDDACAALHAGKCLEVRYGGYLRVVEVHAVGGTTAGNSAMRVWQVRGGSQSGKVSAWKLMRLDQIGSFRMLDEDSGAPRPGYVRGDDDMNRIRCQVS